MEKLLADGWKIITIWECELKKKTIDQTLSGLLAELTSIL